MPRFCSRKIRQDLAADVHHAEDVGLQLAFDLFLRGRLERADNGKPGVVNNGIDAAKFLERRLDRRRGWKSGSVTSRRKHSISTICFRSSAFSGARIVAATFQFLD